MQKSTKDLILDEALLSFSENGYKGTNLRDMAGRIGLSKSALYKHFSGKDDIWNSLINRMTEYYDDKFGSVSHLPPVPTNKDQFKEMSLKLIRTTVEDNRIITVRKLLHKEQFNDSKVAALASNHFVFNLQKMFLHIFTEMINNGVMKKCDAEIVALEYTTTISSLIHLIDRQPGAKDDTMHTIENYVDYFISNHINQ